MTNTLYFLVLCGLLSVASAYWRPGLPPGPYCGSDGRCCTDRKDDCSHRILDTVCYCDQFCNRTHDDCCPDYEEVCLGMPSNILEPCKHNGKLYFKGDKRMDNCNTWCCGPGSAPFLSNVNAVHSVAAVDIERIICSVRICYMCLHV